LARTGRDRRQLRSAERRCDMKTVEELDAFLAGPPPKRKRPMAEPPKADVIPLPKGEALSVAKSERTRASEYDRALERERAWEAERLRRAEALVNSPEYAVAVQRFNAAQAREREDNWFDPTQPFGFRR
jgi:hypothetical protein